MSPSGVQLVTTGVKTAVTMAMELERAEIGAEVQLGDRDGRVPLVKGVDGGCA